MRITKASNSQNRFLRILTLPIRVLAKARDFYVRSIKDCTVSYGNVMIDVPSSQVPLSSLPKSNSVGSSRSNDGNEDLTELIRAASARRLGSRVEMDLYMQPRMETKAVGRVARSCSIAMGRIDEDRPCEFGGDNGGNVRAELVYPRRRSYAVTKRSFGP